MEFSDDDSLLLLNNQFRIVHNSIDNGDLKQIKQNLNLFFKLLGKCNNLKSYNSQQMYNEFLNGLSEFDVDSDNRDKNLDDEDSHLGYAEVDFGSDFSDSNDDDSNDELQDLMSDEGQREYDAEKKKMK